MSATPGERLFNVLSEARKQNNGVLNAPLWIRAADEWFAREIEAFKPKKREKGTRPAPRDRNPLFDALATATGSKNLAAITKPAAKAIGIALAQIQEVDKTLTESKIVRVVEAYRRRWPDPRNLSAMAIAKHWHEFTSVDATRAAKCDPYIEPEGWQPWANELYPTSDFSARKWLDIPVDYRREILKKMP